LSTGGKHVCSLFDNGKFKCWGYSFALGLNKANDIGDDVSELGENLPYFNAGDNTSVMKLVSGYTHTCFILNVGDMKCFGNNRYGQVGIGSKANPIGVSSKHIGNNLPIVNVGKGLKVLDVSLGYFHSCVIVSGNKVKCFGDSEYGQLGYGNTIEIGKSLIHMGDKLKIVNLGKNYQVSSIHSGVNSHHTCVILSKPIESSQRIKCWGYGNGAQLGYGENNDNRGDEPNEMGDKLPLVDLGKESKVKQLSLGWLHTCALLINNDMKCFGIPEYGQIGSGSTETISLTGDLLPIIKIDSGKLINMMSSGYWHSCILYDDLITFKCVGYNGAGQLGQGDSLNRGDKPESTYEKISPIDLGTGNLKIKSIYSGWDLNCVLFVDSSVKCFGDGRYGQFATGTKIFNVGNEADDMGINLKFAFLFGTQTPTKFPTINPTSSPIIPCKYNSSKVCNSDIDCIWNKKCVPINCQDYKTIDKCNGTNGKCKWDPIICALGFESCCVHV